MDLALSVASPETIIYLIVLVIWGFAQLTRLARKKGGATGQPVDDTPRPVPPELRDLLETLTGRSITVETQPPVPPRTIQKAARAPAAAAPRTRAARPAPQPVFSEPQPVIAKPESFITPQAEAAHGHFAAASQLIRQTVASTPVLRLPVTQLASTAGSHAMPSALLRGLRQQDTLRAAIAHRVVLGPPRAFDPP